MPSRGLARFVLRRNPGFLRPLRAHGYPSLLPEFLVMQNFHLFGPAFVSLIPRQTLKLLLDQRFLSEYGKRV